MRIMYIRTDIYKSSNKGNKFIILILLYYNNSKYTIFTSLQLYISRISIPNYF